MAIRGDIEGVSWFRLFSEDVEVFGGTRLGERPATFYFEKEQDLESVDDQITVCFEVVDDYKLRLDWYFTDHVAYKSGEIALVLNVDQDEADEIMCAYAKLLFGEKIKARLLEYGECSFEVDL